MSITNFMGKLDQSDVDFPAPGGGGITHREDVRLSGFLVGQTITLDLIKTSGDIYDPYLQLLDDNGNILDFSDDGGGAPNAQITFVVQPGINYTARVTSFGIAPITSEFRLQVTAPGDTGVTFNAGAGGGGGDVQPPIIPIDGTPGNDVLINHVPVGMNINSFMTPAAINGYAGSDFLAGAGGNDRLDANNGITSNSFDQMVGFGGQDTFILSSYYGQQFGEGFAVIWDFTPGVDTIQVSSGNYYFNYGKQSWTNPDPGWGLTPEPTDTILSRGLPGGGAEMVAVIAGRHIDASNLTFV
ncbi:hypothetical protein [Pseudanabaena sp. PCC 6802]|uniref:hypothetical protein n=1 Tax=Pseudanabaena sp. PCC 6802 TaxID=118173 RepID=UPI0003476A5D|nr:hypothetical protein [Pseudanabaena sp. PCC 6802]